MLKHLMICFWFGLENKHREKHNIKKTEIKSIHKHK